jgi:hypothetical protein
LIHLNILHNNYKQKSERTKHSKLIKNDRNLFHKLWETWIMSSMTWIVLVRTDISSIEIWISTIYNYTHYIQGPAMALRRDIQSGTMNLKDRLSIELCPPDMRHSKVTYGGHVFTAKVSQINGFIQNSKMVSRPININDMPHIISRTVKIHWKRFDYMIQICFSEQKSWKLIM